MSSMPTYTPSRSSEDKYFTATCQELSSITELPAFPAGAELSNQGLAPVNMPSDQPSLDAAVSASAEFGKEALCAGVRPNRSKDVCMPAVFEVLMDDVGSRMIVQPAEASMKLFEYVIDKFRLKRKVILAYKYPKRSKRSIASNASVDSRYFACQMGLRLFPVLLAFITKISPDVVPRLVQPLQVEAGQDMLDYNHSDEMEGVEREIKLAAIAKATAKREDRQNKKEKEFKTETALQGQTKDLPHELKKEVGNLGTATYANNLNQELYVYTRAKLLHLLQLRDDISKAVHTERAPVDQPRATAKDQCRITPAG